MASWEGLSVSIYLSREVVENVAENGVGELTSGRKVHPIRERKPDILKSCGGCLPHRERACGSCVSSTRKGAPGCAYGSDKVKRFIEM